MSLLFKALFVEYSELSLLLDILWKHSDFRNCGEGNMGSDKFWVITLLGWGFEDGERATRPKSRSEAQGTEAEDNEDVKWKQIWT